MSSSSVALVPPKTGGLFPLVSSLCLCPGLTHAYVQGSDLFLRSYPPHGCTSELSESSGQSVVSLGLCGSDWGPHPFSGPLTGTFQLWWLVGDRLQSSLLVLSGSRSGLGGQLCPGTYHTCRGSSAMRASRLLLRPAPHPALGCVVWTFSPMFPVVTLSRPTTSEVWYAAWVRLTGIM